MSLGHGASIVRDGLVLHLDAANVKSYPGSGTTWSDVSGNGNNGTLTNGILYSADNNGVLTFDGVADYFVSNNDLGIIGNNSWSISVLVKVSSSESGTGRKGWIIWVGPSDQGSSQMLSIGVNNGAVEVAHWANDDRFANSEIFFDNWQKIDVTFNGSVETIFVNGQQTDTKNTTLSLTDGKVYLSSRAGASEFLNCIISNIQIYNRALSSAEVKQNFEALRGRYGI
jgi:hypothetical protein